MFWYIFIAVHEMFIRHTTITGSAGLESLLCYKYLRSVLQLCLIYVFAVAMTRTDWRIITIMLPDFSRSRLEDFLVSTGAPQNGARRTRLSRVVWRKATAGRSRWIYFQVQAWFEPVHRHHVLTSANLQGEEFGAAGHHLIWAIVEG